MKKGDIEIGIRAAQLVRKHGNYADEVRRLGLRIRNIYDWEHGATPSGYALQSLALHGYDVHYILTGHRKVNENSAIDSLSEKP